MKLPHLSPASPGREPCRSCKSSLEYSGGTNRIQGREEGTPHFRREPLTSWTLTPPGRQIAQTRPYCNTLGLSVNIICINTCSASVRMLKGTRCCPIPSGSSVTALRNFGGCEPFGAMAAGRHHEDYMEPWPHERHPRGSRIKKSCRYAYALVCFWHHTFGQCVYMYMYIHMYMYTHIQVYRYIYNVYACMYVRICVDSITTCAEHPSTSAMRFQRPRTPLS